MQIRLRDITKRSDGWGHVLGRQVRDELQALIEDHPNEQIIRISLEGVKQTDITFPRTSVIELARSYRGKKGFCISHIEDPDLLENWDAAAHRQEQPITVCEPNGHYSIIGPEPSTGLRDMLHYVLSVPVAYTSEAANALGLRVPNASNKLKQLWSEGYILRREQSASSGGVEYEYIRIA